MSPVTIRRCPVCSTIGSEAQELASELRGDPNLQVRIVDGQKGEFHVDVDGRPIQAMSGDSMRAPSEIADEVRGAVGTAGSR